VAKAFKTSIAIDGAGSAASEALSIKVTGDTESRLIFDAGGKLTWGSGSASGDVTLYRTAANSLKTDDLFIAAGGIVTKTYSGTPADTPPDGTTAVDTTNNKFYFRSSSGWRNIGTSESEADGGTAVSYVRYAINADGGTNGASA